MADDSLDESGAESGKTLEPKHLTKQTLFPVIGASKSKGSGSLLFPCSSFKVDERAAGIGKGDNQPSWLRNESYKDVSFNKSDQGDTNIKDQRQLPYEFSEDTDHQFLGPGEKRTYSEIPSSEDEEREHYRKEHDRKESSRRHHRDKRKHKHKKKHKQKHDKSEKKARISDDSDKPDTIWREEAQLNPEKAYRLSKKPDLANRMYDSLYRLDVALYKMKSNLTCLGISKHQVIELSEKRGKKSKKARDIISRYWNIKDDNLDEVEEGIPTTTPCVLKSKELDVSFNDSSGYISLELPGASEKVRNDHSVDAVKESKYTDANCQDFELLEKTAELNKILRENPHDIQGWLDLVNFQEEVVWKEDSVKSSFTATGREKRKAATRTIIEKKIAVFEKALQQNPSSVELIMGHLDLCSEIMEGEELVQKWKKVNFVHPNNITLWYHYLRFVQSRFSVFSFSNTSAVYGKCVSTLSAIKEGTFTSHEADEDIESGILDLFIQQCQFARQSGHTEKAIALLQALVELNCFCSADLEKNTPVGGQIAFLEAFWHSGQPRFGENGAVGWKTWMAKETESISHETRIDIRTIFKSFSSRKTGNSDSLDEAEEEMTITRDQPLWKNWLQVESSRDRRQLFPWQPDGETAQTEEDCDDPERLVLFDDISSSLFKMADPMSKLKLVLSFLQFFGVQVPCLRSSTSKDVQQFLNTSLEHELQLLGPSIPRGSQFLSLWQSYYWNDDVLCNEANQQWPTTEALTFIRNIFGQSLSVFDGRERSFLMVIWLWYEFQLTKNGQPVKESKRMYKDVRKLAKSLLKMPENRNDLKLWQTYAEIEWISGNIDEAVRVFDSTLMMGGEMFPDEQSRRAALAPIVRSYAELEVGITTDLRKSHPLAGAEGNKKALQILTTFTEGALFQPAFSNSSAFTSAVQLLKARRVYQKIHQGMVETGECQTKETLISDCGLASGSLAVHLEACCVLFEYLNTGINSVLCMCNDFLSNPSGLSELDIELILSSYIKLFKFHCNTGRTLTLKDTRHILHSALEKFPNNPEFISFYIQQESKSVLTGEIRRTLDKVTQKATTPIPWIFALYYEQCRSQSVASVMECTDPMATVLEENSTPVVTSLPITGVVNRQYSLFERAIASPSARHCVALWRMFMKFESQHGKEKVKSVFYQALQNCPWAKVLYLDAAQNLPEDVQDIVDLMTEKEIRLRAPLEEIELLLHD